MKIRRPDPIALEFATLGTILLAVLVLSVGSGIAGYF
jgi:hypothetical protein